jgi:hypothetical protein
MMPSSPSYKPQRLRFISRARVSKLVQAAGNEPRRLGREAKEMWEIFRARAPGYQLRRPDRVSGSDQNRLRAHATTL